MEFNVRISRRVRWFPDILSAGCWLLRRPLHFYFKTNLALLCSRFLRIKAWSNRLYLLANPLPHEITIFDQCLLSLSIDEILHKIQDFWQIYYNKFWTLNFYCNIWMYKVLNNNYIVNSIARVKDTFLHFMNVKQKRAFLSNFLLFFFFLQSRKLNFQRCSFRGILSKGAV